MRRPFAELLGAMLLSAAVIGSGVMAERLSGGILALALLANSLATVAALAVLIASLGAVSGAHFNPAVSVVAAWNGQLARRDLLAYSVAQIAGCCLGAMLAHAMFDLPLLQTSTHARTGMASWVSEFVATAGLVFVAFTSRTLAEASWRVPLWIGAAYWFTGSTSFANPAITIARSMSDTFSGIRPMDVPPFIAAQIAGAAAGAFAVRKLDPVRERA